MSFGGDPDAIRDLALKVRTWAVDVNGTRDDVRAGSGANWVGSAADRYRIRLAEHAQDITDAHDEMIDAAVALEKLADELEERKKFLSNVVDAVADKVDEAVKTVNRYANIALDELTDLERAASSAAKDFINRAGKLTSNLSVSTVVDAGKDLLDWVTPW